jgi:hypothetical protein
MKSNPIPVRLDKEFRNMLKDYAAFMNVTDSEAIRELLKSGLIQKTYIGMLKRWQMNKTKTPNIEICENPKCNNIENLVTYHIDGNIRNFKSENLAILCSNCIKKLNISIQDYNATERFARWMFYEN